MNQGQNTGNNKFQQVLYLERRQTMKKAIGYYNEWEYRVEVDGNEVYTAGNSPFDSQAYTDPQGGVGLETMKAYCEKTTKDLAIEHKAKYAGVEFLEWEPGDYPY